MRPDQTPPIPATCLLEKAIVMDFRNLRHSAKERLIEGRAFICKEPSKAVAYAAGAGYFLGMLPLAAIAGAVARLLIASLRPAVILYGMAKIFTLFGRTDYSETPHPTKLD